MKIITYLYIMAKKGAGRWLLLGLLAVMACQASAKPSTRYTKDKPLIIMCDWAFPPYEFNNNNGSPDGYNIELLKIILKEMGVPYKIVMKEGVLINQAFERGEAHLIVDHEGRYRYAPYYTTRKIWNYYMPKVASSNRMPPIKSFSQLDTTKSVLVRIYDNQMKTLLESLAPGLRLKFCSTYEAMEAISNNKEQVFVWGEEPIKWVAREMDYNITLHDLEMPFSEMRAVSTDRRLIDEIDDHYSRLEQNGKLERIHDRWFNPDREHNDTSPIAIYIALSTLVLVAGLVILNRLAKQRAAIATRRRQETVRMMMQAINISHYNIFVFDKPTQRFINRHGHLLPEQGVSIQELREHIHPDDLQQVIGLFTQMKTGKLPTTKLDVRWKPFPIPGQPAVDAKNPWQYIQGHAFTETTDSKEEPTIVFATKYMTDEMQEERKNSELGKRYSRMFETSLVAMSFYDKDGILIDLNEKMREMCNFTGESAEYFRNTSLFQSPFLRDDYKPGSLERFHSCQHMSFPELNLDRYLEVKARPILDENGKLAYYTVTARDVTDERAIYLEQRRHNQELQQLNQKINAYEEQLYYLLEHSDLWVWVSDLKEKTIVFSRSLRKNDYTIAFDDFINSITPSMKDYALKAFGNMKGVDAVYNTTIKFDKLPISNGSPWLTANGIPIYESDGTLKGHFGIVRDVTKLMEAQEKLRKEKQQADESGKQKSVFLANMTHEIRTPLNAIVGFSDLLQLVDDPDEHREFIRIIRNNCDMLLRLINDIIEASNMTQGQLVIDARQVDFATVFSDICQTLAQRVQEPGVEFITDNPYQTFITTLDKGRMQQVITNFVTNAVKYTHEGHIKVGWAYTTNPKESGSEPKGIYMYCEDTGEGIPQDKQSAVFDRFVKLNDYVQGTGLGLSICKSIADRCQGSIGVESEGMGHGSTFWIWIPCEHETANP